MSPLTFAAEKLNESSTNSQQTTERAKDFAGDWYQVISAELKVAEVQAQQAQASGLLAATGALTRIGDVLTSISQNLVKLTQLLQEKQRGT